MYVRRFTVFPKAQFNFSLVTGMGNLMEEFTLVERNDNQELKLPNSSVIVEEVF